MRTKLPVFIVLLLLLLVVDGKQYYMPDTSRPITRNDVEEAFQYANLKTKERQLIEQILVNRGQVIRGNGRQNTGELISIPDPVVRSMEQQQLPYTVASEVLYNSDRRLDDVLHVELQGPDSSKASCVCQSSSTIVRCNPQAAYRTMDGTCNNLDNPTWGKAFACYRRLLKANYVGEGGFRQSVQGGPLPEPRTISLNVNNNIDRPSSYVSNIYIGFGEMMVVDIIATPKSTTVGNEAIECCTPSQDIHPQCAPIAISPQDPFYSEYGITCLNNIRNAPCRTCLLGKRVQQNSVNSFIDGGFLYGNSDNETASLRRNDGTGMLRSQQTSCGELLPPTPNPYDDHCSVPKQNQRCFLSGSFAVNVDPMLTSMYTIFLREHNRIAKELKRINPYWDEEKLFQESRKILGAEMQVITYNEFLPIALGPDKMSYYQLWLSNQGYTNYNPNLDPTLYIEFNTAGLRFVHSAINTKISVNFPDWRLGDFFFSPFFLYDGKLESLVAGAIDVPTQRVDRHMVDDVTNLIYRLDGMGSGGDLASFDVYRGRDHGLQPYTEVVTYCTGGKMQIQEFGDLVRYGLMSDKNAELLRANYKDVRDVDLITGILSEIPVEGALPGPTAICIVGQQFQNLKFGDRFYFEHIGQTGSFTYQQMEALRDVSLTKIICSNTGIPYMPVNALLLRSSTNPVVSCGEVRGLDLSYWKDNY